MSQNIRGWWDGACEPINPGGVATYGFVVHDEARILHVASGLAAEPFTPLANHHVAEYEGLIRLLRWLLDDGHAGDQVLLRGDFKWVINEVAAKKSVRNPQLQPLQQIARDAIGRFNDIRIDWVPRDQNAEADRLTHQEYVRYMESHPQHREGLSFAGPDLLQTLEGLGVETYSFMGAFEARRLIGLAAAAKGKETP